MRPQLSKVKAPIAGRWRAKGPEDTRPTFSVAEGRRGVPACTRPCPPHAPPRCAADSRSGKQANLLLTSRPVGPSLLGVTPLCCSPFPLALPSQLLPAFSGLLHPHPPNPTQLMILLPLPLGERR